MASKFSEVAAELDKALTDVDAKKALLDSANAAANKASTEHASAISKAETLKQQLNDILNAKVPEGNFGRVRVA